MRHATCKDCGCSAERESKLECRLNPPVVIHIQTLQNFGSGGYPTLSTEFPTVNPDDWCSKFVRSSRTSKP